MNSICFCFFKEVIGSPAMCADIGMHPFQEDSLTMWRSPCWCPAWWPTLTPSSRQGRHPRGHPTGMIQSIGVRKRGFCSIHGCKIEIGSSSDKLRAQSKLGAWPVWWLQHQQKQQYCTRKQHWWSGLCRQLALHSETLTSCTSWQGSE